jgi:serine/threonine protein kinase
MEYCGAGSLLGIYDGRLFSITSRLTTIYVDFGKEVVPCDEDQIAFAIQETVKGLVYLHSLGIIHRDLKGEKFRFAQLFEY